MPGLNRNEKVSYEICGTQTTGDNIVQHKGRCSLQTLYCAKRPNFQQRSRLT